MKKLLTLVLAVSLLTLSLSACSSSSNTETTAASQEDSADSTELAEESSEESTEASSEATEAQSTGESIVVTVAASPTPHAEILAAVKDLLAEEGIDLQVTEYNDYVIPNTAVEEEEVMANYFQHSPYLEQFNEENGTHLVSVAGIHIEPMGLYPGQKSSIDELEEGDIIAVPNDVTNEARALMLLEDQGIITLAEGASLEAVPGDIVENPYGIEIQEVEAAMVPTIKDEVALSVINSNYALGVDLNPVEDSIAIESSDSPYVNVLVVKEGHENDPGIPELIDALTSDTCREFIESTYGGAVVPAF